MQSSSQGYRGYQGYPYVNPIVTDVPSIDAATASRWANLPRRPVGQTGQSRPGPSGAGSSSQDAQSSQDPVPPKRDIDPVVYIDLPEAGSEVSRSIEPSDSNQQQYVEDTIMYDQFENRRIDRPKEESRSGRSSASGSTESEGYSPYPSSRPNPPNTLNLASPGSSSTPPPSTSWSNRGIPGLMTKESLVYGGDGSDGFPLSPIPVSEFPEPPPAYTATPSTPAQSEARSEPRQEPAPPRTQVIVNNMPNLPSAVVLQHPERKNLTCHHCGVRVHTLVIKEIGYFTHFIACIMLLIFMPFIVVVYFSDCFKHKNHYCPNCNRLIGYETPIIGQKVNYVT